MSEKPESQRSALADGGPSVEQLPLLAPPTSAKISQISAFMATNGSPFTLSSIATLFSPAFVLTLMALCSTAMTAITVVAPGSLTILLEQTALNISCTVPTVNIQQANWGLWENSNIVAATPIAEPAIQQLVATIVVQNTYFPLNSQNTCNSSCQYDIEFTAPALQCLNVTDSVDFNVTLPTLAVDETATASACWSVTLWNTTHEWETDGLNIDISFKQGSYEGSWTFLSPQALRCSLYNATYSVTALYTAATNTTVILNHTLEIGDKLPGITSSSMSVETIMQIQQMFVLAEAFALSLDGTIAYLTSDGFIDVANSTSTFRYSKLSVSLLSTLPMNLTIPEMMEFTSLSLLSGDFDFYESSESLKPTLTTCMLSASVYQYAQWRLLSTYGGCIGGAALCVLFGWFAVHMNEGGEALGFERLLESTRVLYGASGSMAGDKSLSLDTKLIVTSDGHFMIPRSLPATD